MYLHSDSVCLLYVCCVWKCAGVFLLWPSPVSIPGEMRVQLLNQTLLDLGLYDDGPYEVADQKQLNARLIPVPYHSYLGRICPPCSLLPVHRREREGRGEGDTGGLRLDPTAANNSSKTPSDWSFLVWSILWLSLSVCDSQSPHDDSTSFFEHFPMWMWVGGWWEMSRAHCGLTWSP